MSPSRATLAPPASRPRTAAIISAASRTWMVAFAVRRLGRRPRCFHEKPPCRVPGPSQALPFGRAATKYAPDAAPCSLSRSVAPSARAGLSGRTRPNRPEIGTRLLPPRRRDTSST